MADDDKVIVTREQLREIVEHSAQAGRGPVGRRAMALSEASEVEMDARDLMREKILRMASALRGFFGPKFNLDRMIEETQDVRPFFFAERKQIATSGTYADVVEFAFTLENDRLVTSTGLLLIPDIANDLAHSSIHNQLLTSKLEVKRGSWSDEKPVSDRLAGLPAISNADFDTNPLFYGVQGRSMWQMAHPRGARYHEANPIVVAKEKDTVRFTWKKPAASTVPASQNVHLTLLVFGDEALTAYKG